MGVEIKAAQIAGGDWDLRGVDIDTRYARFTAEPLSEDDMMALGKAKMVIPAASVGDKLFLTRVSDCSCYLRDLADWGVMVGECIAKARYKRPGGSRRRAYCEAYASEWGAQAAADGASLAVYGNCEPVSHRVDWYGVDAKTYRKVRDFVGGVSVGAIAEFRYALEWAHGLRRDRLFDGRYEAATGRRLKVRMLDGCAIVG